MLLSVSEGGIVLQSPYGRHAGYQGWEFRVPGGCGHSRVQCAVYLPRNDAVAVAVYDSVTKMSSVSLLNATTGKVYETTDGIPDRVASIACSGRRNFTTPSWDERNQAPARVYVLTCSGTALLMDYSPSSDETMQAAYDDAVHEIRSPVPRIPLLGKTLQNSQKKRPLVAVELDEIGVIGSAPRTDNKRVALEALESQPGASKELSRLHGAFARSFVTRHLQRP